MSKSSQWNADETDALAKRVDIDIEKKLDDACIAADYWQQRCEAAEEHIKAKGIFTQYPSDNDAVKLFTDSFQKWHTLINEKHKYIPQDNSQPF